MQLIPTVFTDTVEAPYNDTLYTDNRICSQFSSPVANTAPDAGLQAITATANAQLLFISLQLYT